MSRVRDFEVEVERAEGEEDTLDVCGAGSETVSGSQLVKKQVRR